MNIKVLFYRINKGLFSAEREVFTLRESRAEYLSFLLYPSPVFKYALMFCYYNKQLFSALGLALYEFDASKKCQVSLVVKYIIRPIEKHANRITNLF